jgi:hemoglobin
MKNDILSRLDIELLVKSFYHKVIADEVIGYIFNEVVKVHWEKHLPVMYDFWENTLFYTGTYEGNPMAIHQQLHKHVHFTAAQFDRWLLLFTSTVDELFEGTNANLAKQRAISIATVMQLKILHPAS